MRYLYPCILTPEDEGGFFVSFPDIRGALTCGDDEYDALNMAEDALVAALSAYVQFGKDIPAPSSPIDGQRLIAVPPVPAAKLALYTAMREQGLSETELGACIGLGDCAVRNLLDPDYDSHMSQVEKALKLVGQSLVVKDMAV